MLARSLASCFWAPLGAAYSHDNHLLASSALKSVLASEPVERQTNLTSTTEPMMATPTLAEPSVGMASAVSRCCHACVMTTALRDPPPSWLLGHDAAHDTTLSDKRGATTSKEMGGWRPSGPVCTRTRRARHCARSARKQSAVCRPRCGFSRRLSPGGSNTSIAVAVDVR